MATRKQKLLENFEEIKKQAMNINLKTDGIEINVPLDDYYSVTKIYHKNGYVDVVCLKNDVTFERFPIYALSEEIIDEILFHYQKGVEERESEMDKFNDSQYCGSL